MKYNTSIFAIIASVVPGAFSLPTTTLARRFEIPTCGAETCLAETNGTFDACEPQDLACLCSMDQSEVTRYVSTVQPCIDGDAGKETCTDGAIYQYKDMLTTVCANEMFGNKTVEFPNFPTTA